MKKLLGLLKYEAKTIFRDPLNFYMCLFPLIILVLSGYVFPKIFGSLDLMQEVMLKAATMLFLISFWHSVRFYWRHGYVLAWSTKTRTR